MRGRWLILAATLSALTCGGEVGPAAVSAADACAFCRMAVSNPRFAGEIIGPGQDPRFFDDIGCLAGWLKEHEPPDGATAWVADHRTGEWVQAVEAVFTRTASISTPMGSNIIAHRDTTSRDADPDARNGKALAVGDVFAAARVPRASHAR